MQPLCYIDSKILPLSKARIHAGDIGVLRGYGIYDGIKMYKSQSFLFDDHWKRFVTSAAFLGLQIPVSKEQTQSIIKKLAVKFKNKNPNIKLFLTGGPAVNANLIEFEKNKCTFFIIAEESVLIPEIIYKKGCKIVTFEYQRTYPTCKTTNYIPAVMLQKERKKQKALEILYVFGGNILECSTSNVFIVKNNTVITPKENVLFGITRKAVIQICNKNKIKVEERAVTLKETLLADEVFITSSYKEVMPVVLVDKRKIAKGKPGMVTRKVMEEFQKLV